MSKILTKFLYSLIALSGLAMVFFLAKNFFLDQAIRSDFFLNYLILDSVSNFLSVFIPIYLTSLLVTFSFFVRRDDLPLTAGGPAGPKIILSSLPPLIAGILLNTIFVLSVSPALEKNLDHLRYLSDSTVNLENQLDDERTKVTLAWKYFLNYPQSSENPADFYLKVPMERPMQKTKDRIAVLGRLLAIQKENKQYATRYYSALSRREELDFTHRYSLSHSLAETKPVGPLAFENLVKESEDFLEKKEFERSNQAAFIVLKGIANLRDGGPDDREEYRKKEDTFKSYQKKAEELLQNSWSELTKMRYHPSEEARSSFFQRKGKSLFDYQNGNFLEAYYGFLELNREAGFDREIQKYLQLSKQKCAQSILFREEVEDYMALGGYENLFFLNSDGGATQEFVRIGKMVETGQGVFLKDLEIFRFGTAKNALPEGHFFAPYGRIDAFQNSDAGLVVDVETRELFRPSTDFLPTFLPIAAKSSNQPFYTPKSRERMTVTLNAQLGDLKLASDANRNYKALDLPTLFFQGQNLSRLGYSPVALESEFVTRFLNSLEVIALTFWCLLLAWILRSKHEKTPFLQSGLLFVTLPVATWFAMEVFNWITRLITAVSIEIVGLIPALFFLAGLILFTAILGIFFWNRRLSV